MITCRAATVRDASGIVAVHMRNLASYHSILSCFGGNVLREIVKVLLEDSRSYFVVSVHDDTVVAYSGAFHGAYTKLILERFLLQIVGALLMRPWNVPYICRYILKRWISTHTTVPRNTATVIATVVDADYRGRQLGGRMKMHIEKKLVRDGVVRLRTGVHPSNSAMININRKQGYAVLDSGSDLIVMEKTLV